jgi:aminoglycoside phosphotransferase (APT) family kinase protein
LHADEADIDLPLVRRLLAAQFSQWANLALEPVVSTGTSNALYRLGDDMVVRLPRVEWVTAEVAKEHHWLPRLAPQLPLAVPVPLALGAPAEGYPWQWSVYRWLDGANAMVERVADTRAAAMALAEFVAALQQIDTADGPRPGAHNYFRGAPLIARDAPTREAIASLDGMIDVDAVTAAWEAALRAPERDGPPVWIHGDLLPGNLLVEQGRLSAVIDFGGLAVGDPACDLIGAWSWLSADPRDVFRSSLSVDDATWARGRGWALSVALIALPYYRGTNPVFADLMAQMIDEVLTGHEA